MQIVIPSNRCELSIHANEPCIDERFKNENLSNLRMSYAKLRYKSSNPLKFTANQIVSVTVVSILEKGRHEDRKVVYPHHVRTGGTFQGDFIIEEIEDDGIVHLISTGVINFTPKTRGNYD